MIPIDSATKPAKPVAFALAKWYAINAEHEAKAAEHAKANPNCASFTTRDGAPLACDCEVPRE